MEKLPFFQHAAIRRGAALFDAIDRGRIWRSGGGGFNRDRGAGGEGQQHQAFQAGSPINAGSKGYFVRFSWPVSVIST